MSVEFIENHKKCSSMPDFNSGFTVYRELHVLGKKRRLIK